MANESKDAVQVAEPILTDEQIDAIAVHHSDKYGKLNYVNGRKFARAIESAVRAALASRSQVTQGEPVGEVVACEDYGITIRWSKSVPAIGTRLFTDSHP